MMTSHYIGVDVGTGSVRACVVSDSGNILASSTEPINIWNPQADFYQQSSDNIWAAIIKTVKTVVSKAAANPNTIGGIGFDATCSLALLDNTFQPLTVSLDGDDNQNVMMWMDHRAAKQADFVTATKHLVLDSVGGVMSLEMQIPKVLWIRQNLPKTWGNAGHFFDLPDFLTWRATGSLSRSMCSVVSKWGIQLDGQGCVRWDDGFLSLLELDDLADVNHSKIGEHIQSVGSPCGSGLSKQAATELGLMPGTPVGTSIIDAYAGALACLGCTADTGKTVPDLDNRLALIAGTSTCHIICSKNPVQVPGVWGPFFSSVVPGMWVNEGGQSASGSLIDFVTTNHSAFPIAKSKAADKGLHLYEYLNKHLQCMATSSGCPTIAHLTHNIHVWPDFHGNRSSVADSTLKGMVSGLSLSASEDDLALLYLATIQALAYGTRHIVSEMERCGHSVSIVFLCGGLRKNQLYVQTHTDVLGLPLVLPQVEESVLLGAAMLGACASGNFINLEDVMNRMGGEGQTVEPDMATSRFHAQKFQVFLEMLKDQRKYSDLMVNV